MIERIGGTSEYEGRIGYSRVVVTRGVGGATAYTAGCTAFLNGVVQHPGDPYSQALVSFQAGLFALERAGFGRDDVVQTRMYVVRLPEDAEPVGRAHAALFGSVLPAATLVGASGLVDPGLLVEVELVAWQPAGGAVA